MFRLALALAFMLAATALAAAARDYRLDPAASTVAFLWDFGPDEFQGSMAVAQADLSLDFQDLGRSRVTVAVDASQAQAGFPFATQAMRGPRVLDTDRFPLLTFVSSRVTGTGQGAARIDGTLTVRGVSLPATLQAQLYRPPGTDPGQYDRLIIRLNGALSRGAYGADGWSDLVGDEVRLRIEAVIAADP